MMRRQGRQLSIIKGQILKPAEWEEQNPCRKYVRLVIIRYAASIVRWKNGGCQYKDQKIPHYAWKFPPQKTLVGKKVGLVCMKATVLN